MLNFIKRIIPHDFFLRLWFHTLTAWIAALIYGFPAKKMIVIGVTGTDGKTTTCTLIHSIIKASGNKVGLATTIRFSDGTKEWVNETHKTTLGRFHLQKFLSHMQKNGCTHLVLEVSSHALAQGRITGIPIDIAVITNLSHEHLDYHKTMEHYRDTKLKLFKKLQSTRPLPGTHKVSICNFDDATAEDILKIPADVHSGYSLKTKNKDRNIENTVKAEHITHSKNGMSFDVLYHNSQTSFSIKLSGEYNVANALAAFSVAKALNISDKTIQAGFDTVEKVPGRFELIQPTECPFFIALDYAVTENAFTQLFHAARGLIGENHRIIAIFGACGDRDKEKRPKLGNIASQLCDICIITDEEPYHENPEKIRNMILEGVDRSKTECHEISDRRKAIREGLKLAQAGDIVIVTGMGDQTSRIIGDEVMPWKEREVILEELGEIRNQRSEIRTL